MKYIDNFLLGLGNNQGFNKMLWSDSLARSLSRFDAATKRYESPFVELMNSGKSFEAASKLSRVSVFSEHFYNDFKNYTALSELLGHSNIVNTNPSKFLSYSLGISFEKDLRKQSLLTATLGWSAFVNRSSSKYLTENIFQNDKLGNILANQNAFSERLLGLSKAMSSAASSYHLWSLGAAYNSIAAKIAIGTAAIDASDKLSWIEDITNQVSDATAELYEKGYITKDDLVRIKERFIDYLRSMSRQDWQWLISIIITVLVGLLPFYISQTSTYEQNESAATLQDFEEFKDDFLSYYGSTVYQNGINKRLASDINLRVAPNAKAYSIKKIKRGSVVTVLDVNGDWAYISYMDIEENLPACGWISTKYFTKKTFSKNFQKRRINTKRVPNEIVR